MTPPAPPNVAPARKLRPAVILALTIPAMLIGGSIIVLLFLLKPMIRDRIVEEARRRGVDLTPGDVSVWFGTASLSNSRFQLLNVRGISGHVDALDVMLSGFDPKRLAAEGVQLDVVGSAADLVLDVGEWVKNHPDAFQVPMSARRIDVTWRPDPTTAPWLVVQGGSLTEFTGGKQFTAERAQVAGIQIGQIGAAWTTSNASINMGFGKADLANAPVRVQVAHAATPPTATITLMPTSLEELAGPLGVSLPIKGVTVSGVAELAFTQAIERGPIQGRLRALFDGFVPPHPVELNGFIFGDATTFSTTFAIPADRDQVVFTNSEVTAGAFKLRGGGRLVHSGDHGTLHMDLSGNLSCRAVADAAAKARFGTVLGRLLGDTAKRVLQGSVAVRVTVDADTRSLDQARIGRQIGIGCGLKPLDLSELADLGLQGFEEMVKQMPSVKADLPAGHVRVDIPAVPSGLPSLPSGLPKLPDIPSFDFKIGKPNDQAAPSKGPSPAPTAS